MDFHRLTRRELQTLCKKNKIPANITNVAMADSLKALEIVEGIEEFLQTCESETVQSSIESPVRSEVTSPYVPRTGGRSTRRRNVAKEEPETAKPSTRRTARRNLAKCADESQAESIETPAVVPQTDKRKGQIASACRKMDSQLKECVEEEKKNVLVTPAPSGVTSRRRRVAKEETSVKQVFSTRRSVRLAKKNAELLNEVGNENPDVSKKELFANDCQEVKMNLKESADDLDETSGITGVVDADTTMEENSKKKDEAEVVSAEQQDISTVNEVGLVPIIEEEMSNHSEADGAKSEPKESSDVEIEEVGFGSEIEAEDRDTQKCDKTEVSKEENEAQENDGSHDVQTSEVKIKVEKTEELDADKDAGLEDEAANSGENAVLESEEENNDKDAGCEDQAANYGENALPEHEDNFAIGEVSSDTASHDELDKVVSNNNDIDIEDVANLNVNEEVLEINADLHADSGEKEFNPDESDSVILEATIESTNVTYQSSTDEALVEMTPDTNPMNEEDGASKSDAVEDKDEENLVKDTELELQQFIEDELPGIELDDVEVEEAEEIEIVETEEIIKAADQEVPSQASDHLNHDVPSCGEAVDDPLPSVKNSPSKQLEIIGAGNLNAELPDHIPTCLTPIRASASKASAKKKRTTTIISDNKENIGSGGKLVITKEEVKITKNTAGNAPKYEDMSIRKLSKMLREKLQITDKSSKNENENEVPAARPALQALPENRYVD